ncbi:molybdopterin-dependent oxidoreductase [Streptosporangium sp. KLBMP 9127]|nr:molybdopterin-dependent oxidoreductase [Streptosporangium sp. KLBMP 9127]
MRVLPPSPMRDFITPPGEIFTIAHLGMPTVDMSTWSLSVEGLVAHPIRLNLEELQARPATEKTVFHECFGNPLEPHVPVRRVVNVTWLGVRLAELLAEAAPRPSASHIWFEGLDTGDFGEHVGIHYLKDLPLDVARRDVLLAYGMNGAPLEPARGYPLRSVAQGMFGTNAVKWLRRVIVADARPDHLFTTELYNRLEPGRDEPVPVREVDVNSVLAYPRGGAELPAGTVEVTGWAWSTTEVVSVEICVDDGPWERAQLAPRGDDPAWQRFHQPRRLDPGRHRIRCRAADAAGRVQPEAPTRNRVQEVRVLVREP